MLTNGLLLAGLALMLVGFAFKVAAVPFHMWTPDVYQGAPSPVTGFMSAVAKAGAFAAMLRVLFTSFGVVSTDWKPIIYGLAVLSLVLGAVLALRQRDVKRMLAYSSINHAGFILLGVEAATTRGVSASLYYLFAYTFMTIGSFAVVTVLGREGDGDHDLDPLPRPGPTTAVAGAVLRRPVAGSGRGPVHHRFVGQAAGRPGHHLGRCGTAGRHRHGDRRHRGLLLPPGGRAHVRPHGGSTAGNRRRRDTAPEAGSAPWASPGAVSGTISTLNAEILLADQAPAATSEETPSVVPVPALTAVAIGLCLAVTVVFGVWPAPLLDFCRQATLLFIGQ